MINLNQLQLHLTAIQGVLLSVYNRIEQS